MNTQVTTAEPTQNDRIMAALAHATAIIPMMGVIAPIVIWATQKDKSEYVAFQALQATVYQFLIILVWFGGMVLYMGTFFLVFIPATIASQSQAFPVFFFLPFLVMGGLMLAMLAMIVYGLVAAALTLQGRDFRYILLGNQIKKFLSRPAAHTA